MRDYILVTVHNHPFFPGKMRVLRSRLVMAEYLGRPLLSTELVHHKNENTMDDRIKNLEIMNQSEHTTHHRAGKPGTMLGKHPTEETREKLSLAHKGHPPTLGMSGKHHTSESKRKISLALKGKPSSLRDKHHSTESRMKMSLARKDYWLQQRHPGI